MELYTYYRSTSSYRVRIALALKGLSFRALPVNLLKGEHRQAGYLGINAQGRVPTLRTDGGELLVQSPAIIEYLEEAYPQPALLPEGAAQRAQARGVAAIIGCDIHPCTTSACSTACVKRARMKCRSTNGSVIG